MRGLSISAAWEESRAILARDGQLLLTVAVALIALPSLINSLIGSGAIAGGSNVWVSLVTLLASLIALAGQLALIRLAIGPSVAVGTAIAHGFQRLPIYFVTVLLLVCGLFLLAVPFGAALVAMGVPMSAGAETRVPASPVGIVVALLFLAVAIFLGVRLMLSSAVASAEDVGPIAIIRRSWQLTRGHWWPLVGFLIIFIIGALVLLIGVGSAMAVVLRLVVGSLQPMSAGAVILALIQSLISAGVTTVFAVMLARIYVQLAGRGEAQAGVPSSGI